MAVVEERDLPAALANAKAKDLERARVQQDVEDFLARGGQIERLAHDASHQPLQRLQFATELNKYQPARAKHKAPRGGDL